MAPRSKPKLRPLDATSGVFVNLRRAFSDAENFQFPDSSLQIPGGVYSAGRTSSLQVDFVYSRNFAARRGRIRSLLRDTFPRVSARRDRVLPFHRRPSSLPT